MVRMTTTLEELEKSLKKDEKESDDEEEEAEVTGDSAKKVVYKRVFDEPNLYQTMQVISQTGSKGVSQISLQTTMGVSRLSARRVLKFLLKMNYITMVLEDRGRQKTIMYVDVENVKHNEAHQSVQEEMKKFNKLPDDSIVSEQVSGPDISSKSNKSSKSGKGKARKELPLMNFVEEELSKEKVTEIREELGRIDEMKQHPSTTPMKLTPKQEILKEIQQEGGVQVVLEEKTPKEMTDRRTGNIIRGMKRFGCMLTESHVRRANWILEVVNAIKVVESFILLRLMRNREKEMNLSINMDQKSMKRLVDALTEEGRMRSFKASITMGDRTREFTFLCAPNITSEDENLVRMIEEAKLRYFSVSREELRNRNLMRQAQAKANAASATSAEKKVNDIPQSALDSIRNHQEHKKRMAEKMPMMKYDRKAGLRYGLLPKMLRIRATHEYLFYLSHDTHGQNIQTAPNQSSESTDPKKKTGKEGFHSEGSWDEDDRLNVAEEMSEVLDDEPPVYSNEMSWRRYLPPVPVHAGYPRGWVLLSDCLLIMPVCLFCEIVNVCYNIEGLEELLKHPKKRFYPVINLPFKITQQLLHSKKYVYSISTVCAHMAEMGLLSFGREVVKEKDQSFFYVHQNASLLDTKASLKGYNKTRAPEGHTFPLKTFHFDKLSDLQPYWEFLRLSACNSSLGFKTMVHTDLEDDVSYEVKSLKQACAPYTTETVEDDGIIPGDQRGGAGLDSSIFSHTIKNWSNSGCLNPPRQYRKYTLSKGLKEGTGEGKTEEVDSSNKPLLKGKDRLVLSESSSKPVALKKVTRENVKGNRGGKGIQKKRVHTEVTKTHKIISRMDGKLLKKRCIKLDSFMKEKRIKKKAFKGDEKDQDIHRQRCKLRVVWTQKEDSVLLMCRLATLIMDNKKKISLISYAKVRDYLHEKCGAISCDKTSQAVQRRVNFVLKNPQTETNFLLYYREAMQDEYVLRNFVSREFVLTDEDLVPNFRKLVDYLLDKFKSLDLQKCSLPDSLDDLRNNYTVQYIGKLTPHKMYSDVKNKADICQDVLRNILHSAVLLQDKQGRTHEMFKLLSQYPDQLLSAVVKELRTDGLFVIHKKNYQRESLSQLQTGMGLRNFKVSQRYLYQYKHSYLSAMFDESATLWTQLLDRYLHGNGEDEVLMPFHPQSGECVMLVPLILNRVLDFKINMPQELVIVDMEGFYRFPWGRGKTGSSQTKGDKVLQEMKVAQFEKERKLEMTSLKENNKTSSSVPEQKEEKRVVEDIDVVETSIDKDGRAGDKDADIETDRSIDGNQAKDVGPGKDDGPSERKERTDRNIDGTQAKDVSPGKDNRSSERKEREVNDTDQNTSSTENEKKNTGKNTQDSYTSVKTNHTTIIIPNMDSVDEEVVDQVQGTGSVFASRTLLSLRRAEDCSFDDIRIFNAQDNFVVNSCEIGVKIRDKFEEGKAGNPIVIHCPVGLNEEAPDDQNEESPKTEMRNTKNEGNEKGREDTGDEKEAYEEERAEMMEKVSKMFCDKEKIKRLQKSLQKLLPFKIDMEDVWRRFSEQGVSEEDLGLYKNVFHIIDSYGDLGVRLIDLSKQFDKGYPWREAVGVLMDHSAVLKVGVTCTRYVSLVNARPWVIHAYRNIKGRGVPVDENTEHNITIDEINETDIQTSKPNQLPYLYTEPAGNKPSSEGEQNLKKNRLDTSEEELANESRTVTCEKRPLPEESKKEEIKSKRRRLNEKCSEVTDHAAVSDKDKTDETNINKTSNQDGCSGNLEVKTTSVSDKEDNRNLQNALNKDDNSVPINADKEKKIIEAKTDKNDADREKKDTETTKNDNQESSANGCIEGDNATEDNTEEMKTRKLRKRKLTEVEKNITESTAISTYDKVRLVIQPWRKPEGSINKPILKMMMESVMLYLMMKPGSPEDSLVHRYEPYLQPMILRNIVDILEDIGCVTKHYIRKRKTTLFSKPALPEIVTEEEEDNVTLMVPTEDCVIKLGLFGKEVFPNAVWPDNTYPRSRPTHK